MPKPTFSINPNLDLPMLDITAPEDLVEVQFRGDEQVIWVHVDGTTVLRISRIPRLVILR